MDAIKKKMQAMKIEKDNALDRADAAEEKVRQITEKLERCEEELRDTQKKMTQTGDDLDKAQEDLSAATSKLEEKEKTVQEVYSFTSTKRYDQDVETHRTSTILYQGLFRKPLSPTVPFSSSVIFANFFPPKSNPIR
ncbi:hypothetical protein GCK72_001496 [Caenorhabditis remanei]|uniref:Uncharacterized protein n=1 Tax=Caenorhabditis remanei TaxID=31234 RepID=A0A6A5HPR3_CAERE|nr:hypothetical protein GCK72_001496 [Caenorhabditis remanei]KAF1769679.1 hypothetical protein GCK72_001496 [Caenorhabditis remanei]